MVQREGRYFWVKYHFKTEQGIQNFTRQKPTRYGREPGPCHARPLRVHRAGRLPGLAPGGADHDARGGQDLPLEPFDITKVWPHADYPPIAIGRMVLDRNPENYFADVEQAAFSPGNFVPGIGPSPDKMLQGRLFSYHDTHRHRLGPNYHLLPVNAPKAAKRRQLSARRGHALRRQRRRAELLAEQLRGPAPDPSVAEPPQDVSGMTARQTYVHPNDDFVQAGSLYRKVMTDEDRAHLVGNIVDHLSGAEAASSRVRWRSSTKPTRSMGPGSPRPRTRRERIGVQSRNRLLSHQRTENSMIPETVFTMDASSIKFGPGATREVGFEMKELGARRVMLVTDPNLGRSETVAIALEALRGEGIDTVVFDQVRIEPNDVSFKEAIAFATEGKFDGYVAIGGGSTIDTAKVANLYATYPADLLEYVNAPDRQRHACAGPADADGGHSDDGRDRQRDHRRGHLRPLGDARQDRHRPSGSAAPPGDRRSQQHPHSPQDGGRLHGPGRLLPRVGVADRAAVNQRPAPTISACVPRTRGRIPSATSGPRKRRR